MKKNNMLFLLALIALLFSGCEKDDAPGNAELLHGTWVNTQVNEQTVLTDETFVIGFKPDNTEMYASGFQLDENNKIWQENSDYSYSIDGNIVTINGTDLQGNLYHIEFEILSLNYKTLTYSYQKYTLNGEEISDTKIYTCEKISKDFSEEFTGVWYGRCTTEGAADSLYHYWEYLADGTYIYYYQDEDSNWIKKLDNEARYFLYGEFMASNYSNDILTGVSGLTYECWNFTINDNKMLWTGLRENNVMINYEMEKVASPPETVE